MKQQVAPLHANEVANIRKKSANFDVRQHEFRETFRKINAFKYTCEDPYEQLDAVSLALMLHWENLEEFKFLLHPLHHYIRVIIVIYFIFVRSGCYFKVKTCWVNFGVHTEILDVIVYGNNWFC